MERNMELLEIVAKNVHGMPDHVLNEDWKQSKKGSGMSPFFEKWTLNSK